MPPNPYSMPLPAGTTRAQWHDLGTPNAFRYFEGRHWTVDRRDDVPSSQDGEVYVAGVQELDGTIKREVVVHQLHGDNPITAAPALARTARHPCRHAINRGRFSFFGKAIHLKSSWLMKHI